MSLPAVNLHLVWEFPSHVNDCRRLYRIGTSRVWRWRIHQTEVEQKLADSLATALQCSTVYTHHIHHSWQWPICWKLKFLLSMMMRPVKELNILLNPKQGWLWPSPQGNSTRGQAVLHDLFGFKQPSGGLFADCPYLHAAPPADSLSQSTHRWCWFPAALVQKRCRCQSPDSWPRPGAMDRIGPPLPTATVTAPKRRKRRMPASCGKG